MLSADTLRKYTADRLKILKIEEHNKLTDKWFAAVRREILKVSTEEGSSTACVNVDKELVDHIPYLLVKLRVTYPGTGISFNGNGAGEPFITIWWS